MSGEPATVALGIDGATRELLAALHEMHAAKVDFVLVGGLAVMARLATHHRATTDLDALSGLDNFVALCADQIDNARVVNGHLHVGEVSVDAIVVDRTVSYDDIEQNVDDLLPRLFTTGHRFAIDDASPVRFVNAHGTTTIPVASTRALIITKLHAYLSPRRTPAKGPSDALDIVRLAEIVAAAPASERLERRRLPHLVADIAGWAITEVAADHAKLNRRLRMIGADAPAPALFELLLEDLDRSM